MTLREIKAVLVQRLTMALVRVEIDWFPVALECLVLTS